MAQRPPLRNSLVRPYGAGLDERGTFPRVPPRRLHPGLFSSLPTREKELQFPSVVEPFPALRLCVSARDRLPCSVSSVVKGPYPVAFSVSRSTIARYLSLLFSQS
jgi:hypothetical protein